MGYPALINETPVKCKTVEVFTEIDLEKAAVLVEEYLDHYYTEETIIFPWSMTRM